jgi:ATP-dependent DNA ligase
MHIMGSADDRLMERIVSKRRDARYRSGRSLTWLKVKNPRWGILHSQIQCYPMRRGN